MRWLKNGEWAGDVQGFDDLNRSVLLVSHYQAMLWNCSATGTSKEWATQCRAARLVECFCQLSIKLKRHCRMMQLHPPPPDILFLQSLKHTTLGEAVLTTEISKSSITYIRPVEAKQKWWLCHFHSSPIDWALDLCSCWGMANRTLMSSSESQGSLKTSLCGL